jgi:hypothetical protein
MSVQKMCSSGLSLLVLMVIVNENENKWVGGLAMISETLILLLFIFCCEMIYCIELEYWWCERIDAACIQNQAGFLSIISPSSSDIGFTGRLVLGGVHAAQLPNVLRRWMRACCVISAADAGPDTYRCARYLTPACS